MHYHLIGIAGTAMGSLAGLLRAKGHRVTGSDEGVYPPMSTMLDELGIPYARGFDPASLEPSPDVVVVGNAISRGNPELEAVLDRGLRYDSAAHTIKEEFLRGRHVLAVAGTHGKTTTTSILAWLLESAGLEPSFLVGGVAENFGTSFRLTDSDFFVIEADEYDTAYFDKGPKMWHYLPRTAVVTNVEFDHADIYRDARAYRFAFERFVNLVPRTGTLIVGWETPVARDVAEGSFAPVESVDLEGDSPEGSDPAHHEPGDATRGGGSVVEEPAGAGPPRNAPAAAGPSAGGPANSAADHPRWMAQAIEYGPDGTRFQVVHDGEVVAELGTPLAGRFNVRNCLGAVAAARTVGASWDGIREGLRTFRSVRRRLEVRGEVRGVTVIDDFAHHPTAVRETIDAVRQRFDGRRVVAIFEPRSYTAQRREFQEAYRRALGAADRVILAGLFHPERYDETTGMDPEALVASLRDHGTEADYVPEVEHIVALIAPEARTGDVLLVMSNGGFGGIHGRLLEALGVSGPCT